MSALSWSNPASVCMYPKWYRRSKWSTRVIVQLYAYPYWFRLQSTRAIFAAPLRGSFVTLVTYPRYYRNASLSCDSNTILCGAKKSTARPSRMLSIRTIWVQGGFQLRDPRILENLKTFLFDVHRSTCQKWSGSPSLRSQESYSKWRWICVRITQLTVYCTVQRQLHLRFIEHSRNVRVYGSLAMSRSLVDRPGCCCYTFQKFNFLSFKLFDHIGLHHSLLKVVYIPRLVSQFWQ